MTATGASGRVPLREVVRLAGPALPVLAAEPLYLLVDTAVVGRLGAVPLAGLAVGGVAFAQVTGRWLQSENVQPNTPSVADIFAEGPMPRNLLLLASACEKSAGGSVSRTSNVSADADGK